MMYCKALLDIYIFNQILMGDTKKNNIDLINYSHDREAHCKATANELFNLINNYTDQKHLLDIYRYFEKKYQIPASVVKQTIRQYIARSYILKSAKFDPKLRVKNMFGAIKEINPNIIYADIHLIVGAIPAIILPIFGFISACI